MSTHWPVYNLLWTLIVAVIYTDINIRSRPGMSKVNGINLIPGIKSLAFMEMQNSQILTAAEAKPRYRQDKLGLKQMDKEGKLVFLTAVGDHLQFTNEFFKQNILPFLK